MTKDTLSARISSNTTEKLEEYADERKISKSEATDRLLNKALRIESADVEIVPIATDGSGVEQRINNTETQLEQLNSQVEKDLTQNRLSYLLLTTGLIYIIIQTSFEVPSALTVPVGIGLIGGLLYVNLLR
jgi:hypothetical protein